MGKIDTDVHGDAMIIVSHLIYLQNHLLNPIGIGFGHNPPTFYKVPSEFPYVLFPPAILMRKEGRALGGL